MTIYEFAKLNEDEKANATWNGSFLTHHSEGEMKYAIYAVDSFFVEVSYQATDNKIIGFEASKTNRFLDRYISDIKLDI